MSVLHDKNLIPETLNLLYQSFRARMTFDSIQSINWMKRLSSFSATAAFASHVSVTGTDLYFRSRQLPTPAHPLLHPHRQARPDRHSQLTQSRTCFPFYF